MRSSIVQAVAAALVGSFAAMPGIADTPGPHPAYLHALSDLRDARAHLEHQVNDPVDHEEDSAIANIDKALDEIKKAAIDDGKNIHDHMPVDAHGLRYDRFHQAMELLDKAAVSYQVVLTKQDEVKGAAREAVVAATLAELRRRVAAFPELIFTSAETGAGIEDLRTAIALLLAERGA